MFGYIFGLFCFLIARWSQFSKIKYSKGISIERKYEDKKWKFRKTRFIKFDYSPSMKIVGKYHIRQLCQSTSGVSPLITPQIGFRFNTNLHLSSLLTIFFSISFKFHHERNSRVWERWRIRNYSCVKANIANQNMRFSTYIIMNIENWTENREQGFFTISQHCRTWNFHWIYCKVETEKKPGFWQSGLVLVWLMNTVRCNYKIYILLCSNCEWNFWWMLCFSFRCQWCSILKTVRNGEK